MENIIEFRKNLEHYKEFFLFAKTHKKISQTANIYYLAQ